MFNARNFLKIHEQNFNELLFMAMEDLELKHDRLNVAIKICYIIIAGDYNY